MNTNSTIFFNDNLCFGGFLQRVYFAIYEKWSYKQMPTETKEGRTSVNIEMFI